MHGECRIAPQQPKKDIRNITDPRMTVIMGINVGLSSGKASLITLILYKGIAPTVTNAAPPSCNHLITN